MAILSFVWSLKESSEAVVVRIFFSIIRSLSFGVKTREVANNRKDGEDREASDSRQASKILLF